jgi:nucleotide-binding universal stress UspA family protein
MLPIQTILHPTDFSEPSGSAFKLARSLARYYRARLILLHVRVSPNAVGHAELVPELLVHEEELKVQLRFLAEPVGEVRIDCRVEEGDPANEILRVAEETQANLIVMGTHGRTGLDRLLTGSVAEQILRQAACPVLTVKTPSAQISRAAATTHE